MKNCIPINRCSIKLNPNAGSSQTKIPSFIDISFEGRGKIPDIITKDERNFFVEEENFGENGFYSGKVLYLDDKLVDILKKEDPTIKITKNIIFETINHFPEPKYLFEYENIDITCSECGEVFKSDDLESDSCEDIYSDKICPKCGAWDCCEVEYENIDDVLKLI